MNYRGESLEQELERFRIRDEHLVAERDLMAAIHANNAVVLAEAGITEKVHDLASDEIEDELSSIHSYTRMPTKPRVKFGLPTVEFAGVEPSEEGSFVGVSPVVPAIRLEVDMEFQEVNVYKRTTKSLLIPMLEYFDGKMYTVGDFTEEDIDLVSRMLANNQAAEKAGVFRYLSDNLGSIHQDPSENDTI